MPVIRVEMFKGRSIAQKRNLVRALTEGFVDTCGGTAQGLQVIISEVELEDWGVGGELCHDKYSTVVEDN